MAAGLGSLGTTDSCNSETTALFNTVQLGRFSKEQLLAGQAAQEQAALQVEHSQWSEAFRDLQKQQMQMMEVMTERVDLKVGKAMEMISLVSKTCEARLVNLENRVEAGFEDYSQRFAADRSERQVAMSEVQRELDAQRAGLRQTMTSQVQQERQELLEALSRVCSDLEVLQQEQAKSVSAINVLQGQCVGTAEELQGAKTTLVELVSHSEHVKAVLGDLSSCSEGHNTALADLSGRCEGNKAALADLANGHRAAFADLAGRAEGQKAALADLTGRLDAATRSIDVLQAQVRGDVEALWGQHSSTSVEIEALRSSQGQALDELRSTHGHIQSSLLTELGAVKAMQVQQQTNLALSMDQLRGEVQAQAGQLASEIEDMRRNSAETLAAEAASAADAAAEVLQVLQSTSSGKTDLEAWQQRQLARTGAAAKDGLSPSTASVVAQSAELAEVRKQQVRQAGVLETLQMQLKSSEALQTQLSCDLSAIRSQVQDNVKSLRQQSNRQSNEIETLKSQQVTAMDQMRTQHSSFIEATRARTEATIKRCAATASPVAEAVEKI